MNYKKIVVIGGGVLGSQIAFQTAYSGYEVVVLAHSEKSKQDTEEKLAKLYKTYVETINLMATREGKDISNWARGIPFGDKFDKADCLKRATYARDNVVISLNMEESLKDADLVIESITENIDAKIELYKSIAPLLPEKTVIVTNSSTLLPSKMAKYTGRSNKYLALHFANSIWKNNIAEVMRQSETHKRYFNQVIAFAKSINMIPLVANEEKSGYLLNSLLVPFLLCAVDLVANGVSDPETIDKAWTLGTGAPKGPFQIIDTVGLMTAKNIILQYQKVPNLLDPLLKKMMLPYNFDGMLEILNKYIDKGKLGKSTGEGFYKYDK